MPSKLIVSPGSDNWKVVSSSTKKLNQNIIFESDNQWGFPDVYLSDEIPKDLVSYHNPSAKRGVDYLSDCFLHFFIDDYFFESIWTKPAALIRIANGVAGSLSPTFSVYSNAPRSMNIWNVYRNRWITRILQENNVPVVPVATWSDEDSYLYCFDGLPKNSSIAISTVGTWRKENRVMFVNGFNKMIEVLNPSFLCIYGETMPLDFENFNIPLKYYLSDWKKKRDLLKRTEK